MMERMPRPLAATTLAVLVIAACGDERPPLRTDTAPLQRRVELPAVAVARWRTTTLPDSGGRAPIGPTDVDLLWAYVELAPGATVGVDGAVAAIEVPASVLDILPADRRRSPVSGPAVTLRPLAPDVSVTAVRLGTGLVLRIADRREPPI